MLAPNQGDTTSSPLLTMVYEFERGHGNVEMSAVGDPSVHDKLGIGRAMDLDGDL